MAVLVEPREAAIEPRGIEPCPGERLFAAVKAHGPAVPYRQHHGILRQTIANDDACASIALLEELQIECETIVGCAHAEDGEAGGDRQTTINAATPGAGERALSSVTTITALARHDHQRDRRQQKSQIRPIVEWRVDEVDERTSRESTPIASAASARLSRATTNGAANASNGNGVWVSTSHAKYREALMRHH